MTVNTFAVSGSAPGIVLTTESVGCVSLSAIVPSSGFVPDMVALVGADNVRLRLSAPSKTRSSRVATETVCVSVVVLAAKVSVPLAEVKSVPEVALPLEVA